MFQSPRHLKSTSWSNLSTLWNKGNYRKSNGFTTGGWGGCQIWNCSKLFLSHFYFHIVWDDSALAQPLKIAKNALHIIKFIHWHSLGWPEGHMRVFSCTSFYCCCKKTSSIWECVCVCEPEIVGVSESVMSWLRSGWSLPGQLGSRRFLGEAVSGWLKDGGRLSTNPGCETLTCGSELLM